MKHLKTFITLFLLVIGTSASWAEFKGVTLDFTKSWAASLSKTGNPSDVYVTDITDGEATLSATETEGYLAHILGYYHSSAYGLYHNAKVMIPVKAGMYQITLGISDFGGNIAVSNGTKVLSTINTKNSKGCKFANNRANVAIDVVNVESDCVLEIYASENADNVYFPYISVTEAKPVSGFNVSLVTMTAPVLPAGVTQIGYPEPEYNVNYREGDDHGTSWYAIAFYVNGPVKITLGGCEWTKDDKYMWSEGAVLNVTTGETLCESFETDAAGCSGSGSYEYTGSDPATLYVYCGQYCPYVKVEELVVPAHTHSFAAEWTKTETHHYHACTVDGCDITDYSAVTDDIAAYVAYGEHSYSTMATAADGTYYTCQSCDYVNTSRKTDADAAVAVINLIEYDDACKERITTAANAYDALTDVQKDLVINYEVLTEAQTTYEALTPVYVNPRTAEWNWVDAVPGNIIEETNLEQTTGFVHSAIPGLSLEVDASSGSFKMEGSGMISVAFLSKGGKIMVPVRRTGDRVTVVCGSAAQHKYYTIGGNTPTDDNLIYDENDGSVQMVYLATDDDVRKGYALITATAAVRFFAIKVEQKGFTSVLPMINLNSAGWASFTSLIKEQVVTVPAGSTAYVATAVDDEYVTLTKVTRFTYGEGVFIKGDPNAVLYANTVGGKSSVPSVANNLTKGCTSEVVLYPKSGAYVVATNNVTKKAGFFMVNTSLTVPAGRAYLHAPKTNAKELKIVFEDGEEVTGIESVLAVETETKAATVFYNLAGQVVGKDYKGIVIGNDGKKYVK